MVVLPAAPLCGRGFRGVCHGEHANRSLKVMVVLTHHNSCGAEQRKILLVAAMLLSRLSNLRFQAAVIRLISCTAASSRAWAKVS